jgi:RNA polymerase-binding protein DksA
LEVLKVTRKTKKVSKKKVAKKKKVSTCKNPVKKAVRKKKRKARQKTRLNPAEIQRFREMLLEKWRDILGDVNTIEGEALKKSRLDASGDLSSMPIHMADLGTDNYEQEFALGLLDGERKILREISDALQRIEEGTYGICEGTGKPIPKARLQANPWARYCVEYARQVELGLVEVPDSDLEDEFEDLEDEIEDDEEQDELIDLEDEELEEDEETLDDDEDDEKSY